jgi:hypothetical protein
MKKLPLMLAFSVCVLSSLSNHADAGPKQHYVLHSHHIKVKADPNKFAPSSWDEWDLSL